MITKKEIDQTCDVIRQTAYKLYRYLGSGHLEKFMRMDLSTACRKKDLRFNNNTPFPFTTRTEQLLVT